MDNEEQNKQENINNETNYRERAISNMRELWKTYKIGEKNKDGFIITDIIATSSDFYIYEIGVNGNKRILTEITSRKMIERFCKIIPEYMQARDLVYKANQSFSRKYDLSQILIMHINQGHNENANHEEIDARKMLKDLADKINDEINMNALKRFIMASPFIITLAISIILFLKFKYIQETGVHDNYNIKDICSILTSTTIGGALSSIRKTSKVDITYTPNKKLSFFLGLERLILSVSTATIAFFMLKSGYIIPEIGKGQENYYGMMIVMTIAAFSESFIPSYLEKIEEKINQKK